MLISVLSNKAVLGLGIELLYVWFEVPSQSDSLFVVNFNSKEGGGYNPWFQYNNHSSSSRHFYPQNSLTIINIRVLGTRLWGTKLFHHSSFPRTFINEKSSTKNALVSSEVIIFHNEVLQFRVQSIKFIYQQISYKKSLNHKVIKTKRSKTWFVFRVRYFRFYMHYSKLIILKSNITWVNFWTKIPWLLKRETFA